MKMFETSNPILSLLCGLMLVWCLLVFVGDAVAQAPRSPSARQKAAKQSGKVTSGKKATKQVGSAASGKKAQPRVRPAVAKPLPRRANKPAVPKRRRFRRPVANDLYLATMGGGNWLFTYFGHNAIRVRSRRGSSDVSYNFGTFGFPSGFKNGIKALYEYLQFKMKYWLGLHGYRFSIYWYRRQDRDYYIRSIYLTPQENIQLVRYLRWHALPKNKYYRYHHYTNNCSTKVRDALAKFVGPEFKKRAMVKRGRTYRSMVMEKMSPNPIVKFLMDFGMGPMTDVQRTWWEEMFLPERLDEYVSQPFWEKLRGRPLVGPKMQLHIRRAKLAWWGKVQPSTWTYLFLVLWGLLGLLLWNSRFFRTWIRMSLLVFGLLGAALTFMLTLTKFPEPPGNANIFFYHPLHWYVWWKLGTKRWSASPLWRVRIRWYFAIHTGGALLYLLLKLLGAVPLQLNLHFILLVAVTFGLTTAQMWRNFDWGVVQTHDKSE